MDVNENTKLEDNNQVPNVLDKSLKSLSLSECSKNEEKLEPHLKIGDHYLVRRSNNTWRMYFILLIHHNFHIFILLNLKIEKCIGV